MGRINERLRRIGERPKMFFVLVLFLVFILDVVFVLTSGVTELNMVNCLTGAIFITLLFVACYFMNNGRIALVASSVFALFSMILLFAISPEYFTATNAVTLFVFLLVAFAYKIAMKAKDNHFGLRKYFLHKPICKVSAVVPNYNYAGYLKERVESIVSQTYPVYELVILDDCSTDNSAEVINEIIEDLRKRKPKLKVRFVPNEKNSGNVFKQWEKCFDESEGDFVWICEADDSCSKYFLNAVMRAFDDDGVVLSYAESRTMDENGKILMPDLRAWIDEFKTGHWDGSYINDGKKELSSFLCTNNTIANASGVVFRKIDAPIKTYLHEAQKFRLAGDWYFYSKYLLHGKIAYHAESLNYHRMQDEGVTLTTDKYKQFNEIVAVQKSVADDVRLPCGSKQKVERYKKVALRSFGLSEEELKYMNASFAKVLEKSKVKDEILLSVIVSAYNAEEFLGKCLDSVEKSLPERSEIIVVDDGSVDGTADIAKQHKKAYSGTLRYYRKKNGGLSSVKNFGLAKAKGRYVIFMDADDEIKPNGYGVMLKMALEKDADIVVCDMALIYEDGTVINCPVYHKKPGGTKGFLVDGLMASSNNKMIKRSLFEKVGKYPEGKNNEDVAITPALMVLSKNTQYVPSSFYKYYQRKGSIQNSDFDDKRLAIFDTVEMAVATIREIDPDEAEDIEGIMVSNQLIALLVHVICNIEDENKRNLYIGKFCERYRNLDVAGNKFIKQYCEEMRLADLPKYLADASPKQIYSYIKKDDKIENFKDYIGRALGIKSLIRER